MKSGRFGTPARRAALDELARHVTPVVIDPRLAPPPATPAAPAPTFWLARLIHRNRP